jgi:hypothetical protein
LIDVSLTAAQCVTTYVIYTLGHILGGDFTPLSCTFAFLLVIVLARSLEVLNFKVLSQYSYKIMGLGNWSLVPNIGRDFSLLDHIQTGCGAHLASRSVNTVGSLLKGKLPECEADHLPPSSAKVDG